MVLARGFVTWLWPVMVLLTSPPSIFPGNLSTGGQTQPEVQCPSVSLTGPVSLCREGEECGVWTVDGGVSVERAGMEQVETCPGQEHLGHMAPLQSRCRLCIWLPECTDVLLPFL